MKMGFWIIFAAIAGGLAAIAWARAPEGTWSVSTAADPAVGVCVTDERMTPGDYRSMVSAATHFVSTVEHAPRNARPLMTDEWRRMSGDDDMVQFSHEFTVPVAQRSLGHVYLLLFTGGSPNGV